MNWLSSFRFTRPDRDTPLLLILPLAFSAVLIACGASTHGQSVTQVNSGEVLRIGAGTSEDESLVLNGGAISTTSGPSQSTIRGTIELIDSSSIFGNDGTLTVEGVISGQAENSLTFSRDGGRGGVVRLSGANDYEGQTFINSGLVIADSVTALGSADSGVDSGTFITNFGQLQVNVANSEAFIVSGSQTFDSRNNGNLRFVQDEDITNDIFLASGEIVFAGQADLLSRIQLIQSGATEASLRGSGTNVLGGVGGIGNLTLRGSLVFDNAGLDHSGDIIVDSSGNAQFNVANSYGGDTIVRGSSTLEVNHSSALGTSSNAVMVEDGGQLVVNQNINRDVDLEDGRLTLGAGDCLRWKHYCQRVLERLGRGWNLPR